MKYKEYPWEEGALPAHSYLYGDLLTFLDKGRNRVILDIGCGNGTIANRLLDEGFDVYGIDASLLGIEIAKRKNPHRFFTVNIDSQSLPLELQDKRFDTVIAIEVIEHLYDPRGFVEFCKEILLKNGGGDLIVSSPYHGYLKNLAISLVNSWDKHFDALWDGGHIKFWSKRTLSLLLKEKGFEVIRFKGSGRAPFLWKSMFVAGRIAS